jgi:hypothetical protein
MLTSAPETLVKEQNVVNSNVGEVSCYGIDFAKCNYQNINVGEVSSFQRSSQHRVRTCMN